MLEINFLIHKDGEEALDTAVGDDYVGGQPIGVTTNGKLALAKDKNPNACAFVGLARNDKSVDSALGKVTFVSKGSYVTLKPSEVSGANVYPYAEAYSAYAPKDLLFNNGSGKLSRTPGAAPCAAVCLVLKKVEGEGLLVEILSPVIPV